MKQRGCYVRRPIIIFILRNQPFLFPALKRKGISVVRRGALPTGFLNQHFRKRNLFFLSLFFATQTLTLSLSLSLFYTQTHTDTYTHLHALTLSLLHTDTYNLHSTTLNSHTQTCSDTHTHWHTHTNTVLLSFRLLLRSFQEVWQDKCCCCCCCCCHFVKLEGKTLKTLLHNSYFFCKKAKCYKCFLRNINIWY